MSGPVTYKEIIKMLADNYVEVERSIANQISLKVTNHHSTEGTYRENVWKSLFEMIVPKKYCIEQGVFIIDSYGNKSREVDLAIFDELYTPYIFNYGKIKFIPIEAVAAVVQCKSNTVDYKEVSEWRVSIENLLTSMDSVVRMKTFMADNYEPGEEHVTQTGTRPIMILCTMKQIKEDTELRKDFDIILYVDGENKKIHKYIRREEDSLSEWNDSLNHALKDSDNKTISFEEKAKRNKMIKSISSEQRKNLLQELKVEQLNKDGEMEENVLLSLIFQLNQLLMILNNPMLFPHRAYAKCFNKILREFHEGEKDGKQK